MRKNRFLACAILGLLASAATAAADTTSDRAAALLVFPRIFVQQSTLAAPPVVTSAISDSLIQITNTSDQIAILQCFYVAANGHCSISERPCQARGSQLPLSCEANEVCVPGWTETDFQIVLTPRQPIAWRASRGLSREQFPLDGVAFSGPRGESNAGSAIPPVALERALEAEGVTLDVFVGELKCVVVDEEGRPSDRNAIKGEVTQVASRSVVGPDTVSNTAAIDRHNAIGIQAINGDANGDRIMELGGEAGEYNACPSILVFDHYFDDADPMSEKRTAITLVPCAQNLRAQEPAAVTAQYVVINEFEQRFSTSALVDCWYNRFLSRIDTQTPNRSIFNAAVAGTTFGQTRIRGVQGGLLGVVTEETSRPPFGPDASSNMHFQGERSTADLVVLP